MLKLITTGKCQGCPIIDPKPVTIYAGNQLIIIDVKCSHEAFCDHIEGYLTERLKKTTSGGS